MRTRWGGQRRAGRTTPSSSPAALAVCSCTLRLSCVPAAGRQARSRCVLRARVYVCVHVCECAHVCVCMQACVYVWQINWHAWAIDCLRQHATHSCHPTRPACCPAQGLKLMPGHKVVGMTIVPANSPPELCLLLVTAGGRGVCARVCAFVCVHVCVFV